MRSWAWLLVLIVAVITRLWGWPDYPPGLNQDEASIGYEAYALLNHGIDRHGNEWPVHLISWGSGQHILYAILTMPFIAVFGLTEWAVRMPMLITGILSIPLFAAVVRRILPTDPVSASRAAAWAACILAICPWHVLMSRWALESNLLPFVWLCAIYCWLRWIERPSWRWSIGAALTLSACLYTYSSAYLMVPLLIIAGWIRMIRSGQWSMYGFLRFTPIFSLLSLPIIWFILINRFDLPEIRNGWLTIPRLPALERYIEFSIFHQSNWWDAAWKNIQETVQIFLWQSDGLVWNGLQVYGFWMMLSLPFLILGLYRVLLAVWREGNRAKHHAYLLLVWIGGMFIVGTITDPNVNRLNLMFMPTIAIIGYGIVQFIHSSKRWVRTIATSLAGAMLILMSLFFSHIVHEWPNQVASAFHEGTGEAILEAQQKSEEWAIQGHPLPIVFDSSVRFAQIYTMFYLQLPPQPYADALNHPVWKRNDFPTNYDKRYWFDGNGPQRHAVFVQKIADGQYTVTKLQ